MAYTQVNVTGYNSSPPSDAGALTFENALSWTKIKSKLFDPLKTAVDTINTNIASAVLVADSAVAAIEASVVTLEANVAAIPTTLKGPSGTVLLFRQTTPPTGWTKGTSFDNYALRLVTGSASVGGGTAFTSVLAARTISTANLPAHTHTFSDTSDIVFSGTTTYVTSVSDSTTSIEGGGGITARSSVSGSSDTVTGTFDMPEVTTSSAGSGASWDFAVRYVDCIYATKS